MALIGNIIWFVFGGLIMVMKHFHKPQDEKRSIVVLIDSEYMPWLYANHEKAKALLQLTLNDFLTSEPAPIFR